MSVGEGNEGRKGWGNVRVGEEKDGGRWDGGEERIEEEEMDENKSLNKKDGRGGE